ncbi:MAG: NifB/NifX family molybdenum-iron cluster-binding protein [Chloroflexota bacterium]
MKIIASAEGPDLDSPLGANFARCRYYIVVDLDTMAYEAMANPWANARGGAGYQAAQMAAGQKAQAVLTGMIGPNAFVALEDCGIAVFSAPTGSVRSAVQAFRAAHLQPLSGPNAAPQAPFSRHELSHSGLDGRRPAGSRKRAGTGRRTKDEDEQLARLQERVRMLEEELSSLRGHLEERPARKKLTPE